MSPEEGLKFLALFFLLGGGFWILRPVARAFARKIESTNRPEGAGFDQVRDELLGEVDALRQEVTQLSERLDFTERMLAKQQQPSQLGPGVK